MSEVSLKKAAAGNDGALVIIRPSALAKEGKTGTVAQGTYEGAKPNKFDATKSDYFIRGADDTLYIINQTQSLKEQFDQLEGTTGAQVRVEYGGKVKTKNGKGFHDFNVYLTK